MKLKKTFAPSHRQDPSPITMTDDQKLRYRKEEGEVRLMSNIGKKHNPNPIDMYFFSLQHDLVWKKNKVNAYS